VLSRYRKSCHTFGPGKGIRSKVTLATNCHQVVQNAAQLRLRFSCPFLLDANQTYPGQWHLFRLSSWPFVTYTVQTAPSASVIAPKHIGFASTATFCQAEVFPRYF
jgi:hypothetical protein